MKTPLMLTAAAIAAGHFLIVGALAAPPAGNTAAPGRADFVRVQAVQPSDAPADRMARLWQHRSIFQNALQLRSRAGPAATPAPQSRALRPPEPMPSATVALSPPAGDGPGEVTCEAAADIVAEFGFSDIGNPDCSGDVYRFSAMRDGTAYAIGIRAATGEIAEVSRR